MKLAFFGADPRGFFTGILMHACRALEAEGHTLTYIQPMDYVHVVQSQYYFHEKHPFPLQSLDFVDDFDALLLSNFPCVFDCDRVTVPTISVYDEFYKGMTFHHHADYLLTHVVCQKPLAHANPHEWAHLRGVGTVTPAGLPIMEPACDPAEWSVGEKSIPLAYMGSVRGCTQGNVLLDGINFGGRQHFAAWAGRNAVEDVPQLLAGDFPDGKVPPLVWSMTPQQVAEAREVNEKFSEDALGMLFFDPFLLYGAWVKLFPRVYADMHVSVPWGVGQGAYEAGCCGCVLLETPETEASHRAGIEEGQTGYYFNSREELAEKWRYIEAHPEEARQVAENWHAYCLEHHTYRKMGPRLNWFLQCVREGGEGLLTPEIHVDGAPPRTNWPRIPSHYDPRQPTKRMADGQWVGQPGMLPPKPPVQEVK